MILNTSSKIAAAEIVIDAIVAMASEGRPLMQRVLPEGDLHWWAHYPDNDARDTNTRSRWYYHVHTPGERSPAEHGHFHLFLHRTQIAADAIALAIPAEGENAAAHVTHIAGLSVDHSGIPLCWFVTNRWVTDEFLYPAATLIEHLPAYNVDATEEDATVNRFLTAMVALYRDEIAAMLTARDNRLQELVTAEGAAAYEAGHEVLATCPIDLDAKMESLGLD